MCQSKQIWHCKAFFSISNLTALRELAMQCVAEHVDSDLKESYASKGLKSISLQNELMIAIDGQGSSEYLVRAGCRLAERNGATWTVVNVAKSLDFGQSSANSYKKNILRSIVRLNWLGNSVVAQRFYMAIELRQY